MNSLITWAQAHPVAAATAGVLLIAAAVLALRPLRRTPAAVAVAALAALACTAYSADTSWRFAEHSLDMTSTGERAAMFAAAELGLFACALMARQNLRTQGAPGTPGLLVWVITGVQVIPAYAESGFVGGTVRAVVGPVLAALLWHLAMGIELRHSKPGTESTSLPAILAREVRERLLSRLGLAVRDRTAEQITRDRATVRAVALAAKLADMGPKARGRARVARRLSVAVGKAQAGASEEQRAKLLDLLAARRHAAALATVDLPSPWETTEVTVERVDDDHLPAITSGDAEAIPARPLPEVVPPGTRLLPIVARRQQYGLDHFAERYVPIEQLPKVVVPSLDSGTYWSDTKASDLSTKMTTAVPAEQGREVVTEVITLSPSELRRKARALNRQAVRSTNRPVTIKQLQDELGLSRREATDLRREVVTETLSTGEAQS
ncbi:hypothetical protein [Streptomyces sp. FZ201]|uniref:hypothetical protein n=1 Tax=Streptomyces sp. FZ201 TaxID=3057122 RepID=UPI0021C1BB6B|nr:hypothetical protein [Streptomyces sp. FZ201]